MSQKYNFKLKWREKMQKSSITKPSGWKWIVKRRGVFVATRIKMRERLVHLAAKSFK